MFEGGEVSDELGVIHGLNWLTVNLAESRPLAILVDDVHWADELSLRSLIYIAERLADIPVALIAVIRSGDPASGIALDQSPVGGGLRAADLPRSTQPGRRPCAARQYMSLPRRRCERHRGAMRDTGGNPFLVAAVAKELRENRYGPLTTPASVRRDVARRIGRLTAASRNLAKVASVVGDDAALYDAARLAVSCPIRLCRLPKSWRRPAFSLQASRFDLRTAGSARDLRPACTS